MPKIKDFFFKFKFCKYLEALLLPYVYCTQCRIEKVDIFET